MATTAPELPPPPALRFPIAPATTRHGDAAANPAPLPRRRRGARCWWPRGRPAALAQGAQLRRCCVSEGFRVWWAVDASSDAAWVPPPPLCSGGADGGEEPAAGRRRRGADGQVGYQLRRPLHLVHDHLLPRRVRRLAVSPPPPLRSFALSGCGSLRCGPGGFPCSIAALFLV
jgi:hypothetical protein